jgi:hypothetical protein
MEIILAQLALAAFNQLQKAIELQVAHARGETVTVEQVNGVDDQIKQNSDVIQRLRTEITP